MDTILYSGLWRYPYIVAAAAVLYIAFRTIMEVNDNWTIDFVHALYTVGAAITSVIFPSLWTYLIVGALWGLLFPLRYRLYTSDAYHQSPKAGFVLTTMVTVAYALAGPISIPLGYLFARRASIGD